ncbi:MAG: hypothetical protein BGO98_15725 [Myxococcales bacterium 68-20]|nr:MAG: hypothetical protein BGO98_15725 [Myxococcales bacterium 68-20]
MSPAAHALFRHRNIAFCTVKRAALRTTYIASLAALLIALDACSRDQPIPPPARSASKAERAPRASEVETPKQIETATGYRARIGRGAELFIPPWFVAKRGGYDLIVHFHGDGRWQQANIEHAKLNVVVVSVNLGAGTEPYSNAFKSPAAFDQLLADTQAEVAQSGHAEGAQLRRIALSAWSAGFSSIARVLTETFTPRVDAVLLADGFFTHFTDPKKRTVNTRGLEKFARFAEAARRDEKLFAITHTTIPTGPYPSVQECVAKLLAMIDMEKTPSIATGPREMHQFYAVDQGSFHIRGFEGTQASDHVKQLQAMGETMYPWLKARWDKQDEAAAGR